MKKSKLFTIVLVGLMLLSFSAFAADEKAEVKKEEKVELKNQTNCPVMGGKIDSSSYTDIQGQRVYHCCPGCSTSLEKNPDKYFKKAAADGILFENIQTTCPMSGEKLGKDPVSTNFEGRRLYFCSENCVTEFNKDPQKILKSMDGKDKKAEVKKEHTEDHSGHNH